MTLLLRPVTGVGEVAHGDDLVALLLAHLDEPLRDGDVVVVTSKVVSKALGLVSYDERDAVIDAQAVRTVARRGRSRIVRTRGGLTMAAAGVDASNTAPGTVLTLPEEPDEVAAELRVRLHEHARADVGVIVSDTAGRAWRRGQTDFALGSSGVRVALALGGTHDPYGNPLHVTEPAIADELAGAAELVAGKTAGVPFVVVRGLAREWVGEQWAGHGAASLVRAEDEDLFGLGAREAVETALGRGAAVGFAAAEEDALAAVLALADADPGLAVVTQVDATAVAQGTATAQGAAAGMAVQVTPTRDAADAWIEVGRVAERLRTAARAHRCDVAVAIAATPSASG